jgi:ectoine hydroxylase-related dioxygenase (phytanoyl-CoA dioxygenase family)
LWLVAYAFNASTFQVWIKPPCSGPLAFHRDSTYFDFVPKGEVCTVWLSLDDLQGEDGRSLGPLEYCVGSHLWGDGRRGSAGQFFDSNHRKLLFDAAAREGLLPDQLAFELVRAAAGGLSIHHGRCWHGSGPNISSSRVRRGIGLHYIPSSARWPDSPVGKLWRDAAMASLAGDGSLCNQAFPVVWGS